MQHTSNDPFDTVKLPREKKMKREKEKQNSFVIIQYTHQWNDWIEFRSFQYKKHKKKLKSKNAKEEMRIC